MHADEDGVAQPHLLQDQGGEDVLHQDVPLGHVDQVLSVDIFM